MAAVPLGIGAYKRSAAFTPEVECLNMFLEEDKSGVSPDGFMRIQRPGLVRVATLPNPAQAIFRQDGVFNNTGFAVANGQAIQIPNTVIGSVAGGSAAIVGTKFGVFFVSGGVLYSWNGSVFATVIVPDGHVPIDLDTIDGFVIIGMSSGRYYWIPPGNMTIDPFDFATAESLPDSLVAVRRVGPEFWLFGSDSIEPWQPTGDGDAPFQRATGRVYSSGCASAASVRRFDNSVVWVRENGVVVRGDASPVRISDHGVEDRIRLAGAGNTSAFCITVDGHNFYVLRIGNVATMAFDAATGEWHRVSSKSYATWRAFAASDDDGGLLSDEFSGAVYEVRVGIDGDDGIAFDRRLSATVPVMGLPSRNDSFSIGVSSSQNVVAKVRWKDGQDEFPAYYEELECRAPLDVANLYRLGQPDQPYRTIEVTFEGPGQVRVAGAMVNEAWK